MAVRRGVLPREPGGPRRATLLELFFDLVFVVALSLISEELDARPTVDGAVHATLLLAGVWWVWLLTALVTKLAGIALHDTIRSSGQPPERPAPPF